MSNVLVFIIFLFFEFIINILSLLFFYILISAFFYVDAVSSDISNSVFRLHVIANSDSKEDQNLKYIVRFFYLC